MLHACFGIGHVMSPYRQNTSACKHVLELIIGTDIVERESCTQTVWEGGCIVLGYIGICYLRIQCLLFRGLSSNFKFNFSVVSNIAVIPYSVQQKFHFSFKDGAGRLVKQDRYYHADVWLVFIFLIKYASICTLLLWAETSCLTVKPSS